MQLPIELFLHVDEHLAEFIARYGPWVYGLLFLVVFAETGLVVTPFLPGDSLLFAVGALAARETLDLGLASLLLATAAILGDTVNYAFGHWLGPRVLVSSGGTGWKRLLNRKHLDVRGCWGSDYSHFHRAVQIMRDPAAAQPWRSLPLRRFGLADANRAVDLVAEGRVVKAIIEPHLPSD